MTLGEFRLLTRNLSDDTDIVIYCHGEYEFVDLLTNVRLEKRTTFKELCYPMLNYDGSFSPVCEIWSENVVFIDRQLGV